MTDFDITLHKYDSVWDKRAFQHCRSKVNVTDAVLGFVMVLVLFCKLILIKLHTNVNYDNIWDKLAFQPCWAKIKVTVAHGGAFITLSDFLVIYLFIFELWPFEILSF